MTIRVERVGSGRAPRVRAHIRTLRFLAGEMTQAELGKRVGVTRQTIAAVESGKYSPTLECAFCIAEAFRKPLEEVFRWEKAEAVACAEADVAAGR